MRDIYFWRSANDKHSAQNCAGTRSVDIFLAEIDVGSGLKFSQSKIHTNACCSYNHGNQQSRSTIS